MCVTVVHRRKRVVRRGVPGGGGRCLPRPEGLTDAEAAGFWIPHLTGWIGLVDRGRLVEGDWLAVLGAAGGSGIAAVQLGHALGARVVAMVSDEERAAFCRRLGAEATIIHRDGRSRPRCATSPMGGASTCCTTRSGVRSPRTRRRLRATAACSRSGSPAASGQAVDPRPGDHQHVAGRCVRGGLLRASSTPSTRPRRPRAGRRLRNAVTAEVPFEELPQALQRLADREVVGKLVMVP